MSDEKEKSNMSKSQPSQDEISPEVTKYSRYDPADIEEARQEEILDELIQEKAEPKEIIRHPDLTINNGQLTVRVVTEHLPKNESIVICFVDSLGAFFKDQLNEKVFKSIGIEPNNFQWDGNEFGQKKSVDFTYKAINNRTLVFYDINRIGFIETLFNEDFISKITDNYDSIYFPIIPEMEKHFTTPLTSYALFFLKDFIDRKKQLNVTLSLSRDTSNYIDLSNLKGWQEIDPPPEIIDRITFHSDDPALKDRLGRRPIAKSLAKLINKDIFAPENQISSAYMVHLQGQWGEGKTSFMNFLEEELSKTGGKKWIVVKYNAWKNQHIDPPWWTFVEALYQKGKETFKLNGGGKPYRQYLKKHIFMRLNSQALTKLILVSGILLLIITSLHFFGGDSLSIDWINSLLIYVTFGSTLFVVGKEWNKFFLGNSESAQLFMERVEDPTKQITQHFEELVDSIIKSDKKTSIAFFIDDLDRCNADYVVKLLEGIQTLFRSRNVLYLVAADKDWIAKSFENIYKDFSPVAKDRGASLGNFFVEKNFQLSIRLPKPPKPQIEKYWDYILKVEKQTIKQEDLVNFENEANKYNKNEILAGMLNLEDLAAKSEKSLEEAQSFILEKLDQNKEDVHHLLKDYNEIVGTNARTIKRIANQYTIFRNLILLERNKVDQAKLFRWLVLVNRFPLFIDILQETGLDNIESLESNLKILNGRKLNPYSKSILRILGTGQERLTREDVEIFLGI